MTDFQLKNVDLEDIEDVLLKVATSFDIKFVANELRHVKTFGELCDYIADKIQLTNSGDCTTQQAFYKLRNAISETFLIDKKEINPNLELSNLLPRKNRRLRSKQLTKQLDFELGLLRPPYWVTSTFIIILIASLIGLFIQWQLGLLGSGVSILGLWISFKVGNELDLKTVGQVAEKMTRDNYLKSRRNPKTFNKKEIEKILIDLFSHDLDLDKSVLTKNATFV